jgi:glycosyltransferase involved in cell wall biosynthesis
MINPESAFSVSIIIPLYNGAQWIESTLENVFLQRVKPHEIIVIDDGSQDDGAFRVERIAKQYEDLIRLYRKPNHGVAHTRNMGVQLAQGNLILLLDQDDLLLPDAIEQHLNVWRAQPTAKVTRGNEKMSLVEGHTPPSWIQKDWLDVVKTGSNFSSFILHRSLFEIVGPFNEIYSMASDSDWFSRAKELGIQFIPVDNLTVIRRIHGTNHSAQVTTAQDELTRILHASILRRRKTNGSASENNTL